jgi:hypothetical protein
MENGKWKILCRSSDWISSGDLPLIDFAFIGTFVFD